MLLCPPPPPSLTTPRRRRRRRRITYRTARARITTKRYKQPERGAADLGTETEAATDQLLCYHVLGTPQSDDAVVWAMPDEPTWMSSAEVTDDGA